MEKLSASPSSSSSRSLLPDPAGTIPPLLSQLQRVHARRAQRLKVSSLVPKKPAWLHLQVTAEAHLTTSRTH